MLTLSSGSDWTVPQFLSHTLYLIEQGATDNALITLQKGIESDSRLTVEERANCRWKAAEALRKRHFYDEVDLLAQRSCVEVSASDLPMQVQDRLLAKVLMQRGDIALARSDHDSARDYYARALSRYQRVGNVLGEASCIGSLGDIDARESRISEASERFGSALALFERIRDSYSIGVAHSRLANVVTDQAQRSRHHAAARAAWSSIKRQDLIDQYLTPSS
jgi:tetratricopeptide (TPR) repeat protein